MDREYYCKFKKECIKDNCDCMYEEWHRMSEQNVILCNKIDKAIEYINKYGRECGNGEQYFTTSTPINYLLDILKGSDKE